MYPHIGFLPKLAFEDVIAEKRDIGTCAAMVVGAEIQFSWLERLHEVVEALRISPNPAVNTLLRVRENNERAELPERLDDTPLVCVGVLELVQDDDRVHGGQQLADALTAVKGVPDIRREQVEANATVLARQP